MTRTIALADYAFPWDRLVSRLKFRSEAEWAAVLAPPLAQRIESAGATESVQGVVPVPLSAQRLRQRGYNQAWLLARQLGRRLNVPAHDGLLTRFRHTETQTALHRDERVRNLRGAFGVEPSAQATVAGRQWALVDDVITTGATVDAAAQALLAAGARQVTVWAIARTPE